VSVESRICCRFVGVIASSSSIGQMAVVSHSSDLSAPVTATRRRRV